MSTTTQLRAPVGGCEGIDGLWYEGGQFLPESLEDAAPVGFRPSPEQIAARDARIATDRATSQHIGAIAAKLTIQVTVDVVLTFDGFYGPSYMTIARDNAGNIIIWRGTK